MQSLILMTIRIILRKLIEYNGSSPGIKDLQDMQDCKTAKLNIIFPLDIPEVGEYSAINIKNMSIYEIACF
jgi:hypothetical protein